MLEHEEVGAPTSAKMPKDVLGQADAERLRIGQLEDMYAVEGAPGAR